MLDDKEIQNLARLVMSGKQVNIRLAKDIISPINKSEKWMLFKNESSNSFSFLSVDYKTIKTTEPKFNSDQLLTENGTADLILNNIPHVIMQSSDFNAPFYKNKISGLLHYFHVMAQNACCFYIPFLPLIAHREYILTSISFEIFHDKNDDFEFNFSGIQNITY